MIARLLAIGTWLVVLVLVLLCFAGHHDRIQLQQCQNQLAEQLEKQK